MDYAYYEQLAKTASDFSIDKSWTQGRSIFGGLTTAVVLTYIEAQTGLSDTDLRTINIHFCGPTAEDVPCQLRCNILSQGKSVIQVEGELLQDNQVKTKIVACYSRQRKSNIQVTAPQMTFAKTVDELPKMPFREGRVPEFVRYLDTRFTSTALPYSGSSESTVSGWMRFNDYPAVFSDSAILALVDAWPPAMMPMLKEHAPTSTVTWNVEFMQPRTSLSAADFLYYHCDVAQADRGYAHTEGKIYHPNGQLLALSRQLVAIYDKVE